MDDQAGQPYSPPARRQTQVGSKRRTHARKAEHTAVSFEVDDVDAEVRELTRRGVRFEDYDYPGLKTVNKVCVLGSEKAAWFKDPEGNILCIHQPL